MSEDRIIEAWVNPLAFLDVDEPWASLSPKPVTPEAVLAYLCPPGVPSDVPGLVSRYQQISNEAVHLSIVPVEQRLIERLVWPLRNAKASYMLGNYLATIALCGMTAEMTAMLLWEATEGSLNGRPMAKGDEKALFGRSFERQGQERRVELLSAYQIISDENRRRFDRIREHRRKYLHLWSQVHDDLAADARACYEDGVGLVVAVIGQDAKDGKIMLTPQIIRYLERVRSAGADGSAA